MSHHRRDRETGRRGHQGTNGTVSASGGGSGSRGGRGRGAQNDSGRGTAQRGRGLARKPPQLNQRSEDASSKSKPVTRARRFNQDTEPAKQSAQVQPPTPIPAPTDVTYMNEYYALLRRNREQERAYAVANNLVDDIGTRRRLEDAIVFRGTCQDMCPEYERVERIVRHAVDSCEKVPGPDGVDVPSQERMVKRFRRSAAGDEAQLPSDVRPPTSLKRALEYLINEVVGGEQPLAKVHAFVWDRTRSIRNDFSLQNVQGFAAADLKITVECYELIARFHIHSLHELSNPGVNELGFIAHNEREQLNKTLMSLIEFYDVCASRRIECPNEAEFRAYWMLMHIHDPFVEHDAQDLAVRRPQVFNHPRLQTALLLFTAASSIHDPFGPLQPASTLAVALNNYGKFFGLVRSKQVSYTMACMAEIQFNRIRKNALTAIRKAYYSKGLPENCKLAYLVDSLGFDSEAQAQEFCEACSFQVAAGELGVMHVVLTSAKPELDDPNSSLKQPFSEALVERKRYGRTLPQVICGLTVRQSLKPSKGEVEPEPSLPETSPADEVTSTPPPDTNLSSAPKNPFEEAPPDTNFFSAPKNPFEEAPPATNPFAQAHPSGAKPAPSAVFRNPFAVSEQNPDASDPQPDALAKNQFAADDLKPIGFEQGPDAAARTPFAVGGGALSTQQAFSGSDSSAGEAKAAHTQPGPTAKNPFSAAFTKAQPSSFPSSFASLASAHPSSTFPSSSSLKSTPIFGKPSALAGSSEALPAAAQGPVTTNTLQPATKNAQPPIFKFNPMSTPFSPQRSEEKPPETTATKEADDSSFFLPESSGTAEEPEKDKKPEAQPVADSQAAASASSSDSSGPGAGQSSGLPSLGAYKVTSAPSPFAPLPKALAGATTNSSSSIFTFSKPSQPQPQSPSSSAFPSAGAAQPQPLPTPSFVFPPARAVQPQPSSTSSFVFPPGGVAQPQPTAASNGLATASFLQPPTKPAQPSSGTPFPAFRPVGLNPSTNGHIKPSPSGAPPTTGSVEPPSFSTGSRETQHTSQQQVPLKDARSPPVTTSSFAPKQAGLSPVKKVHFAPSPAMSPEASPSAEAAPRVPPATVAQPQPTPSSAATAAQAVPLQNFVGAAPQQEAPTQLTQPPQPPPKPHQLAAPKEAPTNARAGQPTPAPPATAEKPVPPPRLFPPSSPAIPEEVTSWVLFSNGGLMEQFVDYLLPSIVRQAQDDFAEERARDFRRRRLILRYGYRWKAQAEKQAAWRHGLASRARMRQFIQELRERKERERLESERQERERREQQKRKAEADVEDILDRIRHSKRRQSAGEAPTSQQQQQQQQKQQRQQAQATPRSHQRSRTVANARALQPDPGRLSSSASSSARSARDKGANSSRSISDDNAPSPSLRSSQPQPAAGRPVISQSILSSARAALGPVDPAASKSDFWRLKAAGFDLLPNGILQRTGKPPSRKRSLGADEEGAESDGSSDSGERRGWGAEAGGAAKRTRRATRQSMPSTASLAASPQPGPGGSAAGSSSGSGSAAADEDDDAELFARISRVNKAMEDGIAFYHSAIEEERQRQSLAAVGRQTRLPQSRVLPPQAL